MVFEGKFIFVKYFNLFTKFRLSWLRPTACMSFFETYTDGILIFYKKNFSIYNLLVRIRVFVCVVVGADETTATELSEPST